MELQGAVAIVTGASRGIGRALAVALATEGAMVVCAARTLDGLPERGSLRATVAEIERRGGRALAQQCDVAQADQVRALVEQTLAGYGRVDLLVNNAGVYPRSLIAAMDPALWDATLGVNLTGAFLLCRYALPSMVERRRGSVLNISSGSAAHYDAGHVAYSVAKAGLDRFTMNLAEEVRGHRIAVNALDPGNVESEMGRGDPPESVVPAALWLLRQEAEAFTGRVVARVEFGSTWP